MALVLARRPPAFSVSNGWHRGNNDTARSGNAAFAAADGNRSPDTLLTLAFHGEHPPVYDGIAQSGATDAFTVAAVACCSIAAALAPGTRWRSKWRAERRVTRRRLPFSRAAASYCCWSISGRSCKPIGPSWPKKSTANFFIAHRTALTAKTLSNALRHADLAQVSVKRIARFDLWAVTCRQTHRDERLASLLTAIFSSWKAAVRLPQLGAPRESPRLSRVSRNVAHLLCRRRSSPDRNFLEIVIDNPQSLLPHPSSPKACHPRAPAPAA